MVLGCTAMLKVAVSAVDAVTPVAPDAGVSLLTAGGVAGGVTGGAAVVKDQDNGALTGPELL